MRRRNFLVAVPVIALAAGTSLFAYSGRAFISSGTPKPKIQWRDNLAAAREEAEQTQKPIVVVFKAKWCPHCRKQESTILSEPTLVTTLNNRFIPVRLDLDEHHRTAEILHVDQVPCTLGLTSEADLLGKIVGNVSVETYRDSLTRIRDLDRQVRAGR